MRSASKASTLVACVLTERQSVRVVANQNAAAARKSARGGLMGGPGGGVDRLRRIAEGKCDNTPVMEGGVKIERLIPTHAPPRSIRSLPCAPNEL